MHQKDHPKHERTLVIIKPDGIQRGLIGEIIKRYERSGLKLVAMKMLVPTAELVEKHYTIDPEWMRLAGEKSLKNALEKGTKPMADEPVALGRIILDSLKRYFTAGPVVAMVWEGIHSVEITRKLTGTTEPLSSDVGTIRGDFVIDSYRVSSVGGRAIRNLVHASGSPSEAASEIKIWFTPEEVVNYTHIQEKILYDVNLDGILE